MPPTSLFYFLIHSKMFPPLISSFDFDKTDDNNFLLIYLQIIILVSVYLHDAAIEYPLEMI